MKITKASDIKAGQNFVPVWDTYEAVSVESQDSGLCHIMAVSNKTGMPRTLYYFADGELVVLNDDEDKRNAGCSCGEDDFGAPGHDGGEELSEA